MGKGRLLDPAREAKQRLAKSRRQESRTAAEAGGRVVPGSGNQWHSKSDVKSKKLLIENKRTDKAAYTLRLAELKLAKLRAIQEDRVPLLQVDLQDQSVVILFLDDAKRLGVL